MIVITDDQGYGDLGCHGNPVAQTPHMDRLHDQSVRLTDFHAAPMCTPTRGQLLTGLDAARNGAVNVSSGRTLLRPELQTMADLFRAGGYSTGMFGKWHLGDNYPYRPHDRGFEESLWFPSSHINSLPDYWENDYFDDVYCRNGARERYDGYCTEVFFREAMAWMETQVEHGTPFFAYLPTNAPHAPLWVPAEDRESVEESFAANQDALPDIDPADRARIIRFLAMIRNVDRHLGRLMDFLRAREVERNTILIFMTDNGSTFGPLYFNAGMRGAKCSLWEGGHRVPCFIRWPDGNLGEPRDLDGLTQVQDILPTLIDFCGLEPPTSPLDGISLASALRGTEPVPPERMLAVNYSRMPRGDYPMPDSESIMRREGTAVLYKRWRLLEDVALYDLDTDPQQQNNVIDQHPDIASKMREALDRWWQEVEPLANQVQRIIIGSEEENPMLLSACEWQDVFVDQQRQVRVGVRKNSYWHLEVERAGTYEFRLRRWPRESGLALDEACSATTVTDGVLEPGRALPIARARLMIDGQWHTRPVEPGQEAAVFTVDLGRGPKLLHTWFDDAQDQPLCGAYYVRVARFA
ncbi:MAG: arylsulfatase [Planctomycetota bacterium]